MSQGVHEMADTACVIGKGIQIRGNLSGRDGGHSIVVSRFTPKPAWVEALHLDFSAPAP